MSQKKIQITNHGVATLFHKEALQFVLRWLRENNKKRWRVHVGWIESVNQKAANCPLWPPHMVHQGWNGFHSAKIDVLGCYQQAPELAEALLFFLQRNWRRIEKSKLGRLKKFLSYSPTVPWMDDLNLKAAVTEAEKIRNLCDERAPKTLMDGSSHAVTQADLDYFAFCRKLWASRKHSGPVPDKFGNVAIWTPDWDLQDSEIQRAISSLPWGNYITVDDVVKARRWVATNQIAGKKLGKEILDKDGYLCVK